MPQPRRIPLEAVVVDAAVCIAAGNCELNAPGAFELSDDDVAHVQSGDIPEDQLRNAIRGCPSGAIRIERHDPAPEYHRHGPRPTR